MIEPVGGVAKVLEWIVDGEHDALRPDLGYGVDQRGRAEVARSREIKIRSEISRNRLARRVFVRGLHPIVAIVDAPEIVRQAFAEMAEDDLQSRMFVEQSAADQAQCMHRGFRREGPRRSEQPWVTFVQRRV